MEGKLPKRIGHWSLTSLQLRLVKTGGRLVKHVRYYWLLLAESHLTRRLFGTMVGRIESLPLPAGLSPEPARENLGKQAEGMARCLRNRVGNESRCRLTPSRRRTAGCHGALASGVHDYGRVRAGGMYTAVVQDAKMEILVKKSCTHVS